MGVQARAVQKPQVRGNPPFGQMDDGGAALHHQHGVKPRAHMGWNTDLNRRTSNRGAVNSVDEYVLALIDLFSNYSCIQMFIHYLFCYLGFMYHF